MSGRCDLCGAAESRLLEALSARSLRSDRRIVPGVLRKAECQLCGLVRSAREDEADEPGFYEHEYRIDGGDHLFLTASGPRRRSAVMADWIATLAAAGGLSLAGRRVFEVGAGRGFLMAELSSRWPGLALSGMELSEAAAAEARTRGLDVTPAPMDARPPAAEDVIIAVAVIEHVTSPTAFLEGIRRRLRPGGHAILIQPTQDVASHDLLFVDHLHHFGVAHVRAYARKCGFDTVHDEVGFALMPNFSAHLLRASGGATGRPWDGPTSWTCARATVAQLNGDLQRFERTALDLKAAGRPFGVFGLHEAFAVARAYSSIDEAGIAVGLADDAGNPDYHELAFPVVTPDACPATGVADVFLTMNKVHYPYALARLAGLGVRAIPVFG